MDEIKNVNSENADVLNKISYEEQNAGVRDDQPSTPYRDRQPCQLCSNNIVPVTPQTKDTGAFGLVSMILGIISFFGFGILTAIPGLIFGIISVKKKKENIGMAIAGIATSAFSIVIEILITVNIVIFIMKYREVFVFFKRVILFTLYILYLAQG